MKKSDTSSISNDYQTICYTFIFPTRAHRRIFLIPDLTHTFKELVIAYCQKHSAIIHSIQCATCFVILKVELSMQVAPSQFITNLKVFTSKELRTCYSDLQNIPSLWKRTLLVSTEPQITDHFINTFLQYEQIGKEDCFIHEL